MVMWSNIICTFSGIFTIRRRNHRFTVQKDRKYSHLLSQRAYTQCHNALVPPQRIWSQKCCKLIHLKESKSMTSRTTPGFAPTYPFTTALVDPFLWKRNRSFNWIIPSLNRSRKWILKISSSTLRKKLSSPLRRGRMSLLLLPMNCWRMKRIEKCLLRKMSLRRLNLPSVFFSRFKISLYQFQTETLKKTIFMAKYMKNNPKPLHKPSSKFWKSSKSSTSSKLHNTQSSAF